MGMDLEPINPTIEGMKWGRYNWAGWTWLLKFLEKHDVDISEFSGVNDGDIISKETCIKVADTIEKYAPELTEQYRDWILPHAELWRNCGGYRQW